MFVSDRGGPPPGPPITFRGSGGTPGGRGQALSFFWAAHCLRLRSAGVIARSPTGGRPRAASGGWVCPVAGTGAAGQRVPAPQSGHLVVSTLVVIAVRPLPPIISMMPRLEHTSVLPKPLEPVRRERRVAHRRSDRPVTEVMLDGARVLTVVGQLVAAAMAQHVAVDEEPEPRCFTSADSQQPTAVSRAR